MHFWWVFHGFLYVREDTKTKNEALFHKLAGYLGFGVLSRLVYIAYLILITITESLVKIIIFMVEFLFHWEKLSARLLKHTTEGNFVLW